MYKTRLIFDSDGLIKLVKANLPKEVFDSFKACISEEVYIECVIDGKKGLYYESFEIESLITDKKIIKKKSKTNSQAIKILKDENFGKWEESILHLFFNIKADAIISDDKKFLNFLFNNELAFMTPTDLVISLYGGSILDRDSASKVLEGLRPFVKDKYYFQAKNKLEVKKWKAYHTH